MKLIGRTDAKDSVELSSTEEDALLLRLMNGYKREFKIHLIESTSGTAPLPKLEFDARISMSKSVFEKVLGRHLGRRRPSGDQRAEGGRLVQRQERHRCSHHTAGQERCGRTGDWT